MHMIASHNTSVAAVEVEAAVAVAGGVEEAEAAVAEWYAGRQGSGGAGPCTYVLRTGDRTGEQYGGLHATQRCFGRLTDAWRAQFPDATEIPRWGDLLRSGVAIFDHSCPWSWGSGDRGAHGECFDDPASPECSRVDDDPRDDVDAVEPVEVAVDPGASGGAEPERAEPGGAGSGGAEPERAEPVGAGSGGAEPERAEPGGAEPEHAEPGVAESGGAEPAGAGPGGPSGALSRRELPSPQELRTGAGGAAGAGAGVSASAGGAGAMGPEAGAGGAAGVGATGGTGAGVAVSAGGPAGVGAAGVGADAGGAGVVLAGSGGATRPRPYFVPLLQQVLGLPPSSSTAPSLECPPPVQSESQLQLASPLPAPSPYTGPTGGIAERREPESRPASPVRTARTSRRVPRPRPSAVPGTHQMALRPSTAPQRVPLPSPPESSLPALADPASDSLRAASPTVTRFLATVVTDPSFESTAASALVVELVDFTAHCRLDYAASLVAESTSVCPPSVGGECALSTDVLEDRQKEFQCFAVALPHLVSTLLAPEGDPDAPDIPTPRSYAEAIEGPYSSQWQAAMDAEMASWKSTGTYVNEVPPPRANIVNGMWIFRVKRPPGSPPVFKARYVARGFSQRQGVDYFQTFSPTPKMTTLQVLLHVAARRDYELHCPPGFTGSFPPGTQTTLAALGFAPSTADPSLFLRTDTLLPPFYILVYVDDLVFATADTAGLAHVKSPGTEHGTPLP
ncbi:unnamed protein product [Closterium sp. NIES-53]